MDGDSERLTRHPFNLGARLVQVKEKIKKKPGL
jgi:hypothetical protein